MITTDNLRSVFTYHPPTDETRPKFMAIRESALEFAYIILKETPRCADQQAAIRKVREAVMTANAAIATKGAA